MARQIEIHHLPIPGERIQVGTEEAVVHSWSAVNGEHRCTFADGPVGYAGWGSEWRRRSHGMFVQVDHRRRGSRVSRSASPRKLKASTVIKIAAPGTIASQGVIWM